MYSPFWFDRAFREDCWNRARSAPSKTVRVQAFESVLVDSADSITSLDGWALVLPLTRVLVTQARSLDFGRGAWASQFTGGRGSSEVVREKIGRAHV